MDISDIIKEKDHLEKFIDEHFERVIHETPFGPLLVYDVELVNKSDLVQFCGMKVQQCWVKKAGTLYAFFMLIKRSAEIEKHVSRRYGAWETKEVMSVEDHPIIDNIFTWSAGPIKIEMSPFSNPFGDPGYVNCDLVICRTMSSTQLWKKPNVSK